MKLTEIRRLNFSLGCKLIFGYTGEKVLHTSLVANQKEIIAYANLLARLDLYHGSEEEKYYFVKSPVFGEFYLRKPFSSDYKVFEQIFVDQEYLFLAELIEKYCNDEEINFIDGGANIGLTTVYIEHYLRSKKKLNFILVEPFEDNLETAKKNIQYRNIKNVHYEMAGLHNKDCYLKISHDFRDGMEWSIQIVESTEPTNLKAIEIPGIVRKYNLDKIDVLKIDIEGSEKFLFEDEKYASAFLQKVSIIAIELHDEYNIASRILSILESNHFKLQKYGEMYVGIKDHLLNK